MPTMHRDITAAIEEGFDVAARYTDISYCVICEGKDHATSNYYYEALRPDELGLGHNPIIRVYKNKRLANIQEASSHLK
jgi:hypothetical protein